ncbi:hypothetical protein PoB_003799700, partial [Plakobranchus ocellatus]
MKCKAPRRDKIIIPGQSASFRAWQIKFALRRKWRRKYAALALAPLNRNECRSGYELILRSASTYCGSGPPQPLNPRGLKEPEITQARPIHESPFSVESFQKRPEFLVKTREADDSVIKRSALRYISFTSASPQQGALKLPEPPPGQDAKSGAGTHDKRIFA